ncbi:MAG: Uma2 family endonuclease [bacterium]|nr:Uma2 family endonuclease [bacterium]
MEQVIERVGMPLDTFLEAFNQQPFELINGAQKILMPGVAGPNYILRLLVRWLEQALTNNPANIQGELFYEMTFVLPEAYNPNWVTGSRTPDLMIYLGNRWADYIKAHPDWREKPYLLVPDFVVEIVSPNDRYSDIDEKVDAYLADGVRLIWVIDPQRRKATIHTPINDQPLHLKGDTLLSGGDVLPGFEIRLSALFE